MTKGNYYAEKIIAVFQIIFGVSCLYVLIYGVISLFNFAFIYNNLSWKDVSIIKFMGVYHAGIILDVLTIIGGILLLLNKKFGWVLTLTTSLASGIFSLINLYSVYFSPPKYTTDSTNLLIMNLVMFLIFFLISFTLILKFFKLKYRPTKGTWQMIIILIAALVADKFIFKS